MREERKLNKAIMQDGIDDQLDLLEELKRRYPQYVDQSDVKKTPVRKRRVTVFSALAAVAVCAAIIVPCAVLLPNNVDNGGKDNIRYCTQNDYSITDGAGYTIGEYRENNNRNFLYFDWYQVCEECKTTCYTSNSDNEVLCLKEQVYLPQSDEFLQFSITKSNIYLSEFDQPIEKCKSEQEVDKHSVKWSVDGESAICIFEDGGYRYFIQIFEGQDKDRLFWWVSELLGKN